MNRQTTGQVMVFKTNIKTEGDVHCITDMLNAQQHIAEWSVDTDDVDCVLRIVSCILQHSDVIKLIALHGYECAELEY